MKKYPLSIRTVLLEGFSRDQSAQFETGSSRSGKIYTKRIAANQPTFIKVNFKFNSSEAQMFLSWFNHSIKKGFDPFMMFLCTEWGKIEYECQFMPDSLLLMNEKNANIWSYSATIMIRDYGEPSYFPPDLSEFPEYSTDNAKNKLDIIVNTILGG